MTNVIYAYAYIALYYIGDYLNCAEEAANVFLIICGNMKSNEIYKDADSAIESVIENVKSVSNLYMCMLMQKNICSYINILLYM